MDGLTIVEDTLSKRLYSYLVPKHYLWRPKSDITPYELAMLIPVMLGENGEKAMQEAVLYCGEKVRRHIEEV